MALITPGIHESLALSDKTKINDKGTLELVIKSVDDPNALFNAFESNEIFQDMESKFIFYPPSLKDYDQNEKSAADIGADLLKIRHQLLQYAYLVAPKEEADKAIGGTAMFQGIGVPQDQIKKAIGQLNQEDFLYKVNTNLAKIFLDFMKSKKAFDGSVTFRQKFLRQSEAKNYATIPTSSFDVWIEPMDVPKEASKIAFSEWEIKNNKHLSTPVSSDPAASSSEDANKASSLFSAPTPKEDAQEEKSDQPDLFAAKPDAEASN